MAQTDSPPYTGHQATQAYLAAMGFNARLYTGAEYIRTYPNVSGHPFLEREEMQQGRIAYFGVLYPDIPINYDIVRDEVITRGPQVFALRLVPEKIDSFAFNGRRFIRAASIGLHQDLKGFYEILYTGKVLVLAKRTKQIKASSATDEPSRFEAATKYFVVNKGTLYRVADKSQLLQAFKDQREAVGKKLQQEGLDFRRDPAAVLQKSASFYDQINN